MCKFAVQQYYSFNYVTPSPLSLSQRTYDEIWITKLTLKLNFGFKCSDFL